jgi:hypothetical protein
VSRLRRILEEDRQAHRPELRSELVSEVGAIEERNQFTDARKEPQRELRALIKAEVDRIHLGDRKT